jgi:hypothetical protein
MGVHIMETSISARRTSSVTIVFLILAALACSSVPATAPAPAATGTASALPLPSDTPAPTATLPPSFTPTLDLPLTETALASRCAAVPDGLVGWWPGDGNAVDLAGGNDGALHGGAGFAPGKVGQAFSFDGLKSSVDVPRAANLDMGKQVSVEFWMQPDRNNTMSTCCQGLVGTDYYLMEISGGWSRTIGLNWVINTGRLFHHTSDQNEAAFQLPPGEWSYIVGTYDGQLMRLYVNGKEELQVKERGRVLPMLSDSFLSIGSEDGRTDCPNCIGRRYFIGLIDEVSIYNRALTPEEILSIFAADDAGKCTPSP